MSEMRQAEIVVTHKVGLHARPSVALTKLAKKLNAKIEIAATPEGPWIDAKSVIKVMGMKVPQGATLYLRGDTPDTDVAMDAILDLIRRDFDLETKTDSDG